MMVEDTVPTAVIWPRMRCGSRYVCRKTILMDTVAEWSEAKGMAGHRSSEEQLLEVDVEE